MNKEGKYVSLLVIKETRDRMVSLMRKTETYDIYINKLLDKEE
jgi:hypothetical protein